MTNSTQKKFVEDQLKEKGEVSRNFCLGNFITRLGAIIFMLKEEGWDFDTEWRPNAKPDGSKGKDFIYRVKQRPKARRIEIRTRPNGEKYAQEVWE